MVLFELTSGKVLVLPGSAIIRIEAESIEAVEATVVYQGPKEGYEDDLRRIIDAKFKAPKGFQKWSHETDFR